MREMVPAVKISSWSPKWFQHCTSTSHSPAKERDLTPQVEFGEVLVPSCPSSGCPPSGCRCAASTTDDSSSFRSFGREISFSTSREVQQWRKLLVPGGSTVFGVAATPECEGTIFSIAVVNLLHHGSDSILACIEPDVERLRWIRHMECHHLLHCSLQVDNSSSRTRVSTWQRHLNLSLT